jgi:hypothetical protein
MITGANNCEILTIKDPVIKREGIAVENTSKDKQFIADASKTEGLNSPIIKINNYRVPESSIIKFRLNSSGFIPTLDLVFIDDDELFTGDFAKDGDLLQVYIRSANDKSFKKIRTDFDILKIGSQTTQDEKTIYSFSCVQKIPDLFREMDISLKGDTSFNHLIQICDLTGLGFASNEVSTNDKMNRPCANKKLGEFINDLVSSTYKNDDSFFTSYIDIYDYLCLVNVNSTFSLDTELEDGEIDSISTYISDKSSTEEGIETKIVFTNHDRYSNSTNYITKYSPFNNSGEIWMNSGYSGINKYVDMDELVYREFNVDPLTTKGAEKSQIILKGKPGDNSYKNYTRCHYLGRQYSTLEQGNLHPNYMYAKTLNSQNNIEINKMGINIELRGFSSNIYRYKRVPIIIFKKNNISAKVVIQANEINKGNEVDDSSHENENEYILDNFLSGFYVVRDYRINWVQGEGFTMSVSLVRREWNLPNSVNEFKKIK